jgi:hypothetical protein
MVGPLVDPPRLTSFPGEAPAAVPLTGLHDRLADRQVSEPIGAGCDGCVIRPITVRRADPQGMELSTPMTRSWPSERGRRTPPTGLSSPTDHDRRTGAAGRSPRRGSSRPRLPLPRGIHPPDDVRRRDRPVTTPEPQSRRAVARPTRPVRTEPADLTRPGPSPRPFRSDPRTSVAGACRGSRSSPASPGLPEPSGEPSGPDPGARNTESSFWIPIAETKTGT